jgi:hypothetical protein
MGLARNVDLTVNAAEGRDGRRSRCRDNPRKHLEACQQLAKEALLLDNGLVLSFGQRQSRKQQIVRPES